MAFAKLYLVFGTLSMECILVFWMVFLVLGTVLGIFNIVFGIWESVFGNLDSVFWCWYAIFIFWDGCIFLLHKSDHILIYLSVSVHCICQSLQKAFFRFWTLHLFKLHQKYFFYRILGALCSWRPFGLLDFILRPSGAQPPIYMQQIGDIAARSRNPQIKNSSNP